MARKAQDKVDALDYQIKQIENNLMFKIIDEVEQLEGEERPKRKYTNEKQRELAFETQIKDNEQRSSLISQKIELQKQLRDCRIGHDFLDRKLKSARTMAQLIAGEGGQ